MRPTANFSLFETAEALGRPVGELLTGVGGPLSNMELYLWGRYRWAKERLRQQNSK
jgi:hypothetical protein